MADTHSKLPRAEEGPITGLTSDGEIVAVRVTKTSTVNGVDYGTAHVTGTVTATLDTGASADLDSGGGTDTVALIGIALPSSGGAAAVSTTTPLPVREQVESLTFTHSNVSLGNSSTTLISSNANRKALVISNDSDTKIYVNLAGGTASATAGVPLAAGGSLILSPSEKLFTTGTITGITSTGSSKSINIAEGV